MNYAWDENKDGQNYSDGFESIEECVEDAKGFGCKIGDIIYVGEARKVPIKGVDLGSVLESVHDEMYDEVGELAYDWTIEYPNHDKKKYLEYQEKLKQLVMDYLKEIGMEPGFFQVINSKPVVIK